MRIRSASNPRYIRALGGTDHALPMPECPAEIERLLEVVRIDNDKLHSKYLSSLGLYSWDRDGEPHY